MRVNSYEKDAATPAIGSRWIWEPNKSFTREVVTVTDVTWNGEEWWVLTIGDDRPRRSFITGDISGVILGRSYWNDLSRFWESVRPIPPRSAQ
jgi:hypothetical protein